MPHHRTTALAGLVVLSGCGLILDLDPPDPTGAGVDAGVRDAETRDLALADGRGDDPLDGEVSDGGTGDPCTASPLGTPCDDAAGGPALICSDGSCVASFCGDGVVDSRTEECDDANELANDGCEPVSCELTCLGDVDCPPAPTSCLAAVCRARTCGYATSGEGDTCPTASGGAGVCTGGTCRRPSCGDSVLDSGEECDDGNVLAGDGCDSDCTFTCTEARDCTDGNPCNGDELCNTSHMCVVSFTPCDAPPNACSRTFCEDFVGCRTETIDEDGDGHSPASLGTCGDDCDDTDAFRQPGAPEVCNGVDDDCDGAIDDGTGVVDWFADRDGDAYGDPETRVSSCAPVPGAVRRAGDCFDAPTSTAAIVNPGQLGWFASPYTDTADTTSFDYDCSGDAEKRFIGPASTCSPLIDLTGCGGAGWVGAEPECGATGAWRVCRGVTIIFIGLACSNTDASRAQECR